jgi:hemin uptake protein HemP
MRIVIIPRVHNDSRKPSATTGPRSPGAHPQVPARTTSQALLGTARELIIEHDGREYRLRLTQQGKLILTA